MLRISNLKSLLGTPEILPNSFITLECVRWRRKPRWLPVAKSKMFRVPPRTITPEDEKLELMRLYNNYRTQMKGIRSYLHGEYNVKSVIIDTEEHEKIFMEEFKACSAINDAWNEQRKKERESRHNQELEKAKQIAYKRLDEHVALQEKLLESAEEMIKKEKVLSKTFITPETLDEAIEHALKNPVDNNFSIDLDGNIYKGRNARPEVKVDSN